MPTDEEFVKGPRPPEDEAAAAIHDSELMLEALLDCFKDRVHIKDIHSRFIRVNKVLADNLSLADPAQAIGKTDADFFTQEEAAHFREIEQQVMQTGVPLRDMEIVALHPVTKATTYLLSSKAPVRDRAGRIVGIAGITQDVTETKTAKEARRKSEEKFETVFQTSPQAIVITRLSDGTIVEANEAAERLTGFRRDEGIHHTTVELGILRPEDRDDYLNALVADGTAKRRETPYFTKSGAQRTALLSGERIEIDGEPCLLHVIEDITEIKEAALALRESEARNRALLAAMPDSIFLLSEDGTVIDYSGPADGSRSLYASILSKHIGALLPSSLVGQAMRAIRQALNTRSVQLLEFQTPGPTGPHDYEARLVVCGERSVMALLRDITFYRRLERQVLEVSAREEQRIGHDLHDGLGQELTGIAFLTKALADRLRTLSLPESEDAQRLVDHVNKAIGRVRALARGLSPAGMEERGLIVALEGLARDTSVVFNIPCAFHCDIDGFPGESGVQTQLFRIAQEAVHNAVRHSGASKIEITLTEDKEGMALRIRDNGAGFDENRTASSGMGLHIMRYRASMANGTLSVASQPGKGTVIACILQ